MIEAVALAPGTQTVGPEQGALRVHTYREGMAQKAGHDLVIDVVEWEAKVEVSPDGTPTAVELQADPGSLGVIEGRRGIKPLTDSDRKEIRSTMDREILRGQPIAFKSSHVGLAGDRLDVDGELTLAGSTRQVGFVLELSVDGHVTATLPVTQSEWGIKPYRAFMGALKVRDQIEVKLEANLQSS